MGPADLAADVALVARVLARLGYVHAFGHVSARVVHSPAPPPRSPSAGPDRVVDNPAHPGSPSATLPHRGTRRGPEWVERGPGAVGRGAGPVEVGGGWVLLTPTFPPLGELEAADVLELDQGGRVLAGAADRRPLEAPLHLAIYVARPEVGAVCRLQGPAVAAFAATGVAPPLLHGFGGMVEPVAFWDDPDLVAGEPDAGRVAAALGPAPAMLLAGNGGLTVGADLDQALARAWCLEDRCRVALAAGDRARSLSPEALERRRRWYDAETARLARWLRHATGP
jgi:HCOMODA/2-hydroxy-3-carboxy-muconic semialdehyde decarboxylase